MLLKSNCVLFVLVICAASGIHSKPLKDRPYHTNHRDCDHHDYPYYEFPLQRPYYFPNFHPDFYRKPYGDDYIHSNYVNQNEKYSKGYSYYDLIPTPKSELTSGSAGLVQAEVIIPAFSRDGPVGREQHVYGYAYNNRQSGYVHRYYGPRALKFYKPMQENHREPAYVKIAMVKKTEVEDEKEIETANEYEEEDEDGDEDEGEEEESQEDSETSDEYQSEGP